MVLVFSANANASPQIIREVERAVSKGLTIMPLRIEDVAPGRNLEYFLGTPHWLDAITPPLERHLEYLTDTVSFILERGEAPTEAPGPAPLPPRPPKTLADHFREKPALWAAVAVPVLLVLGFASGIFGGGDNGAQNDGGNGSGDGTFSSLDRAFGGKWDIESIFDNPGDGSTADWSVEVAKDGKYTGVMVFKDAGRATYEASRLVLDPATAPDVYFRSVDWVQTGNTSTVLTAGLIPPAMLQFLSQAQPQAAGNLLSAQEQWQRTAGSGSTVAGTWTREAKYGVLSWLMRLEIKSDGAYTFSATLEDSGTMFTDGGKWRQVSEAVGLLEGDYQVVSSDAIILKYSGVTPIGGVPQVTWRRTN